jgi:thymidylate kinase
MKALISKGVTLVVDRYAYSGIAFSAAKKVSVLYSLLYDSYNILQIKMYIKCNSEINIGP